MTGIGRAIGENLLQKMLALDTALSDLGVPYAFGGAIALDYYTEPRATTDLDVNVFCAEGESSPVLARLEELGAEVTPRLRALVERDGQARFAWGAYKVDLFFSNTPFHQAMAQRVRKVPFLDRTIPILAPEHLLACKAAFSRPKDWLDIENLRRDVQGLDLAEARRWVVQMVDREVLERFDRLMRPG